MEQGDGPKADLATAKAELAAVDIRLEVLTPSANDRFGSSFLPAWD
jgi:hypothetical protein